MKKTIVQILFATLFLLPCDSTATAGGTAPRPPLCPPDAVCNPSASLFHLDPAISRLRDTVPRPPICPPGAVCT
jgi:hypothetical protein